MGFESPFRNHWQWWWKIKQSKIYKPYFWGNKRSKVWGFNLPFIGYFGRYYGEIKSYNMPAKQF